MTLPLHYWLASSRDLPLLSSAILKFTRHLAMCTDGRRFHGVILIFPFLLLLEIVFFVQIYESLIIIIISAHLIRRDKGREEVHFLLFGPSRIHPPSPTLNISLFFLPIHRSSDLPEFSARTSVTAGQQRRAIRYAGCAQPLMVRWLSAYSTTVVLLFRHLDAYQKRRCAYCTGPSCTVL
jgi:hypothetical protein